MRKCGDGQRAAPRRRRRVEGEPRGRSLLLVAASASCASRGDGLRASPSKSRRPQSARTAVAPRQISRVTSRSGQPSRYAVAAAHHASGGGSRRATPSSLRCAKAARTGVKQRQSRRAASKPRQPPHRAVAAALCQNRRDSRHLPLRCAKAAAPFRAKAAKLAVTLHRYRRYAAKLWGGPSRHTVDIAPHKSSQDSRRAALSPPRRDKATRIPVAPLPPRNGKAARTAVELRHCRPASNCRDSRRDAPLQPGKPS